jgi:integrase
MRGLRVRLFQMRRRGTYYRDVWLPGRGKDRRSLGTTDRRKAERLGQTLLAQLIKAVPGIVVEEASVTLGDLWRRFSKSSPDFLDNHATTRRDAEARARTLVAYFGDDLDVRKLTADDQAGYTAARIAGGIPRGDGTFTPHVRMRSAQADLVVLHQMLRWATTVRIEGLKLLDANPLAGVRLKGEHDKLRPVATWDRFVATRKAMQELAAATEPDTDRMRWVKLELALVLAEATGRRLGAIRQLQWEDCNWTAGTIHWRAAADKKRRDSVIPMPPEFMEELRTMQRRLGALGGPVFSAEHDASRMMDRHLFDKWLTEAERKARPPKLHGGAWHPYRRKWATERKHLAITDVAAAGGWQDVQTLLDCYQQPTNDSLLTVMSEERKLRDRAVVQRNG